MRVVLNTSILKLATFPAENNASALIYARARAGLIEAWVSQPFWKSTRTSSAIIQSSSLKLSRASRCCPLTELSVIQHEPDNRFLECALAADAEFIVTVNTAPGYFDRKQYQAVRVARATEFLNVPEVGRLVKKLTRG